MKFVNKGGPNEVMDFDGGYISYNPFLYETALYAEHDDSWRILNGDFRRHYLEAGSTLEEFIKVYDKYKDECWSPWSTI